MLGALRKAELARLMAKGRVGEKARARGSGGFFTLTTPESVVDYS